MPIWTFFLRWTPSTGEKCSENWFWEPRTLAVTVIGPLASQWRHCQGRADHPLLCDRVPIVTDMSYDDQNRLQKSAKQYRKCWWDIWEIRKNLPKLSCHYLNPVWPPKSKTDLTITIWGGSRMWPPIILQGSYLTCLWSHFQSVWLFRSASLCGLNGNIIFFQFFPWLRG